MANAPIASHLLQSAATSGTGNSVNLRGLGTHHTVYIEGSAGIASGALQIETADEEDYSGTWASIGSPVNAVASSVVIAQFTGAFRVIRARISTNITGGNVTAKLVSAE